MRTKITQHLAIIIAIGFLFNFQSYAQENDAENYRIRFGLSTKKQPDNSRVLEASFVGTHKKDRKDRVPVYNADINFYNVTEEGDLLLGTVKTDQEGTAQLTMPGNQKYITNDEGYINFKAVFDGTDDLDGEESELAVKDILMELLTFLLPDNSVYSPDTVYLDSNSNEYQRIYIQYSVNKEHTILEKEESYDDEPGIHSPSAKTLSKFIDEWVFECY